MADADRTSDTASDPPAGAGFVAGVASRAERLGPTGWKAPAARVWLFSALLGLLAVLLYVTQLRGAPAPAAPFHIPWVLVALGCLAAELKVVDVHFRREKHSFSLSEFPAVIGMFLLPVDEYLLAVLVGSAVALVAGSRVAPIKLAFNLALFAAVATISLTIFHGLAALDGFPGLLDWTGAFAATLSAAVFSALAIATVIALSGGAPQFQKLPEMLQFGTLVAVANTSLALLAVSILWLSPPLLWLLVVPLGTVFLAYRAYLSEREKHERLELLYQSSRILQHSPELDRALIALLQHAREMFRAERAQVVLHPRSGSATALLTSADHDAPPQAMLPIELDQADPLQQRIATEPHAFFHVPGPNEPDSGIRQAMVAPLRGESGLIGSMQISNRLTEGTNFAEDDLRLLETLANQAAVALENGQLEQSLAELSRLKEQLRYQAYHDPLTGLANRSLFTEQVNERLAHPKPGWLSIVLFLDLDDFKVVNDTLGHAAGDRLLVAVADRIRSCVRTSDVAARLGGDEFGIVLEDDASLARAVQVTHRILDALKVSFLIQGQEITVTGSIGLAAGRPEMERADELLRNADVAMYTAKGAGKGRFAVFDPSMHAAIVARHALSSELSRGIERGELAVHYQPIVSLATGEIAGLEALVRWRHPVRGVVGPDEFVPLAEESGAIIALGDWVLAEACRQVAAWRAIAGVPDLFLTVNLSAAQLQHGGFVGRLREVLEATGLPSRCLVLEMTETAMFLDTQTTIARLEEVRALGVQIAVDDFGTGYSSLGYLRRFQVDILKIAREFVGRTKGDDNDWAFAHAIVALGRTLGLRIVAEGIEETDQLNQLRLMGCEFGQGYLFARPVEAGVMAKLLDRPAMSALLAGGLDAPDVLVRPRAAQSA